MSKATRILGDRNCPALRSARGRRKPRRLCPDACELGFDLNQVARSSCWPQPCRSVEIQLKSRVSSAGGDRGRMAMKMLSVESQASVTRQCDADHWLWLR